MSERDPKAIRSRCERALSHEPMRRRTCKAILEELARATPDELAIDVYGEGDVIASFEREVATLLGKPAAVFLPSGTMAQPIALRIHADRRRLPVVAFHPKAHLELHEERAYDRLHGLSARLVGHPQRLVALADLERLREPVSALLLELPQREIGGQLPAWSELEAIAAWAKAKGVALHLDGARLWETRPFYARSYAEICAPFDSVYVSFYKILGGIAGSVLAGEEAFVGEARVWQRRQGGNLVSLFPYVLAARKGLERLDRIELYCAKARELAARLATIEGITITPSPPHANLFHALLEGDATRLADAALDLAEARRVWLFERLATTDVPNVARLEITCTEATLELSSDEIAGLFEELLERAKAGRANSPHP